jgi:hypothetical protein
MHKTPSIDLGSVRIPDDATLDASFGETLPTTFRDRLRAEKKAQRGALAGFTTKQLKDELLERNVTDFSRVTPWLKCALLLVIMLLFLTANIGSRLID